MAVYRTFTHDCGVVVGLLGTVGGSEVVLRLRKSMCAKSVHALTPEEY
jgi:hypothetical protein